MLLYPYVLCISKIKTIFLPCYAAIIPPNKISNNPLKSSDTQSILTFPWLSQKYLFTIGLFKSVLKFICKYGFYVSSIFNVIFNGKNEVMKKDIGWYPRVVLLGS